MIPSAAGLFLITVLISIHGSQQADCDENEFQCTNGECIDSFLVCDGEANCQDASDETKHVCSKSHVVCQPFAFRCAYGACIDGIKKCDGNKDCADNSDENLPECKKSSSNSSSTNNCLTGPGHFQCNSGQCIDEWVVCDGELDCRDGSDESDTVCVNFPCPQILGFQCSYGGCIDKLKQCNGVKDCRDNSDEDPLFCAPPSTTSPGRPSTSPITPEMMKCIWTKWAGMHSALNEGLKKSDSDFPSRFDEVSSTDLPNRANSDQLSSFVIESYRVIEHCLTQETIPLFENDESIYGSYVASRLKGFTATEKIEIKHKIDNLFYVHYKNKIKKP